ncbi:MAG: hypothetical protein N2Z84_03735 [Atribacterota bacterium]|nr:hypothetical protein [Atribacterota bacterium]
MLTVKDVWRVALNHYISEKDAKSDPFEKIPAFSLCSVSDKNILTLNVAGEIGSGLLLEVTAHKSGKVSIAAKPDEYGLSFSATKLLIEDETFEETKRRWHELLQSFDQLVQELAIPERGGNTFFVLSRLIAQEKMYRVLLWSGYTVVGARGDSIISVKYTEEKGICIGLVLPLSLWDVFVNEKNRAEITKSPVLRSLVEKWKVGSKGSVDVIVPWTEESEDIIRLIYEYGLQKLEELRQHLQKQASPLSAEIFSKALFHKIEG